jgi:hypothetical protein
VVKLARRAETCVPPAYEKAITAPIMLAIVHSSIRLAEAQAERRKAGD